jgi:hypothetical protein
MIRAIKKFFHVPNHNMHHGQPLRCLFGWCYSGHVLLSFLDRIHGRQSVSTNRLASLKVVIKKVSNAFARNIWYGLHRHITSLGASFFNGHQYGLFSASTSSPFSGTLSSNIGVIKFYNILQAVYAVTVRHRSSDFFKYIPRCRPGDSKLLGKSQSRDPSFIRSDEVNSPKPLNQRQVGRVEQCSSSNGSLGFTFRALIYLTRFGEPGSVMATFGAHKTIGPTVSSNSISTCFLRTEFLLSFKQTDLGHFHGEILL